MNDFNLSDKISISGVIQQNKNISVENVKEFIRLLKEEKKHIVGFEGYNTEDYKNGFWDGVNWLIKTIDKLAGSELTKPSEDGE